MEELPFITFVIPTYNVEEFLPQAVESVIAQTLKNWTMIIVDDGSTDRSYSIAKKYAEKDSRISVMRMSKHTGGAYQPRKKAIISSSTELVAPLDADDFIDCDYLERLYSKLRSSGLDAIYPTMWKYDKNGIYGPLMDPSFIGNIWEGKECVKFTLDGWRINCNGGLIKRKYYMDAYDQFDSEIKYGYADELLTRQLLWLCPYVGFSEVPYYYRINLHSVTHSFSSKQFELLINNRCLVEFTRDRFEKNSVEQILAARQNFHGIADAILLSSKSQLDKNDREYADMQIRISYSLVDWSFINKHVSFLYYWALRFGPVIAGPILRIIMSLKRIKSFIVKRITKL